MSWVSAWVNIIAVVVVLGLVGWYYGYPLQAVILALCGVIAFWSYQMHKVRQWLQDPVSTPPDVYGIWGELLARIYFHQRRHKKVEKRLQSNVRYLEDSFSSMREGVVMVDKAGGIKWSNEAAEPLLGLRSEEDRGQTLTNLVRDPEFTDYFLGDDYSKPLHYLPMANPKRHLQVEVSRFGGSERLLFIRDVSSEFRVEQMRRDFVANVSHELRTPLTVITGYLDTMASQEDALPTNFTRALEQMRTQAQRMEALIKDLLWLSRIEHEVGASPHQSVDIPGMLRGLQQEVAEAHPEVNMALDLQSEAHVTGDYKQLYSAISNLVLNAVKYGSGEEPIQVRWEADNGGCLLTVQDRGQGIDETHIPRLTERFYRVDDSRNAASGGTGLGLAIVKHVAVAHGATLGIDSKLGRGSTFRLHFPTRH